MSLLLMFLFSVALGLILDWVAGSFPAFFLLGVFLWFVNLFILSSKNGKK